MYNTKIKYLFVIIASLLMLTACSNIDIQTLNLKAKELLENGDVDGAIGRLESITDLNPNYYETYYNLGVAYYKKGQIDKAVNALNHAIKLNKDFPDTYFTLGVIYEDAALSIIDKSKEDKSLEKYETLNQLVEYLKAAKDYYSSYLKLAKTPADADSIKSRIESIDADLDKYQTILIKKYDSSPNSAN